ncbi:choline ABC transporter ATP-binding protein [Alteribacter lacisalsi]|uniref:Carnitine transport ATP-binding protein OpuCA n=1 Tax=Alteribacter lacisalsi TaxID=2045244 RepID=A0A2W0HPT3_9BACI|nr:ABC transporter ATP-binding protein [Alteribacter lacisalsi]PYZ95588.1 choline ABC transporter ATP-binding protein [Alteribacter lacisalsi]
MIQFKDVTKQFDDGTKGADGLNFSVEEGEFFVLIGPSGCGKTTTMKMINRLIEPSGGTIRINGKDIREQDVKKLRWNIGYVLQQIALFPHMTIAENIAVVPEMIGWKKEKTDARIDELLEMVGMEPVKFRNRKPKELSGGQQQRIGVVRALAGDPDILLMDEPFSALDPISREQLQKDFRKLQKEIKKTIVFVTHDMDEALALGSRVCVMQEGRIVQIDTPENLVNNPASSFVKQFIGDRGSVWENEIRPLVERGSPFMKGTIKEASGSETWPLYLFDKTDCTFKGIYTGKEGTEPEPFKWTLTETSSIKEAMNRFKKSGFDVLPVVEKEKLIGTLTLKDTAFYLNDSRTEGSES